MKTLLTLTAATLLLGVASATEMAASHQAAIEKLLDVLQIEKQVEQSMRFGVEGALGMRPDLINELPPGQQDKFNKAVKSIMKITMEDMSWAKLKPDFILIYGKNFTEKETTEIIALMSTPTGQLLASKQAAMVGDVTKVMHERMKTLLPKMMMIMQQEMQK